MPQNEQIFPYQTKKMPPSSLDFGVLIHPLAKASSELARYDTVLHLSRNPKIIGSIMLAKEEATLSSRIEGTQATLDEVFMGDIGVQNDEKRNDLKEIENYENALQAGQEFLIDYKKISLVFVRELHNILMKSVRGQNKDPGNFRRVPVWIGPRGSNINNASFVPPDAGQVPICMSEWIDYLEKETDEPLIQAALMHAQFELVHPFLDGNGRLGRILIPLFLYQKNVISAPTFYISTYLEKHRDAYYQGLRNISQPEEDWTGWVRFFLEAVAEQAQTSCRRVRKINALWEQMEEEILRITRSRFTPQIVNTIFAHPYCNATDFINNGIRAPSAYLLIKRLEQHKVLKTASVPSRRDKVYAFGDLLEILLDT